MEKYKFNLEGFLIAAAITTMIHLLVQSLHGLLINLPSLYSKFFLLGDVHIIVAEGLVTTATAYLVLKVLNQRKMYKLLGALAVLLTVCVLIPFLHISEVGLSYASLSVTLMGIAQFTLWQAIMHKTPVSDKVKEATMEEDAFVINPPVKKELKRDTSSTQTSLSVPDL